MYGQGDEMEIPQELAQRYLRRRLEDLEILEKALMTHDFRICEEIGHRLRGSAQTYGFHDLAELGESLEKAATKEDETSLVEEVNSFRIWIDKYIN